MTSKEQEECDRMVQLRRVFEKSIDASVEAINQEHLSQCFGEIADTYGSVLEDLSRQMLHAVRQHMHAEFDKVCEEYNVNERLKQLDEMSPTASQEEEDIVTSTILRLKQLEKAKYEQAIQQLLQETADQERQFTELLNQMQQYTDTIQAEADLIAPEGRS